ncbi:unnamed protein product [Mycetohabitans rhizoxinica HKI 454]|uniref:Uncharacterized protein n=2 Tax=Mycetohabitans rhizoxinica TaxID=412963 RepID=E5AQ01_MYCRK|nr:MULTISPECIES: hypothetical protein [Mycetohabitans]MCF7695510.1 hypothetical protein [Mycetohabitans sp. B2]MCG1046785.1 hypothetical protein [Mycetohabitans sp. B6]CBW74683.1 unnamed protein product [Mycetohabitans rhizoxinica HKI 454]
MAVGHPRLPAPSGTPHGGTARAYLGALAAGAVKLAGNASGLFEDGEVLEWSLCVLGAMTAVAVTVSLGSHPFCR